MNELKQLKTLWPKIPNWAREDILKIATISTKKEQWKLIIFKGTSKFDKAHKGKYQISTLGRIRHAESKRIVTQYNVWKSCRPVHPIMGLTFLGKKPKGYVVMHLDGDGTTNWIGNLRYGTYKENAQKPK